MGNRGACLNKKQRFSSTSPLSSFIFKALRLSYFSEVELGHSRNAPHVKEHVQSVSGISSFQLAGATWEAVLNERFLSDGVRASYPDYALFEFSKEIENWSLIEKTKRLPKFFFGRSLDVSNLTFSNLNDLIEIRNSVTHFKNSLFEGPDKAVRNLRSKKVTYPRPLDTEITWHAELMSTECIRFCVNTVSKLVHELSRLETEEYRERCGPVMAMLFAPISDREARETLSTSGFDPDQVTDVGY